jgi:hypothetical protein
MEQRNNLVLHGTETFSRGALDNVALESGAVVLDSSAGSMPGTPGPAGSALASGHRITPAAASKPRARTGWCS